MMKGKERFLVTLIALFLFFSMSIGYAVFTARTNINGTSTFTKNGKITISNAVLTNYRNLQNPVNPTIDGMSISFMLDFYVARTEEALNDDYFATYQITIDNDTFFDYSFSSGDFHASITTPNEEDAEISYLLEWIEPNEIIPSKETKTFSLTINLNPNNAGDFTIEGTLDVNLEEEQTAGSLIGSIPRNSTGNLVNNDKVPVVATVINSFEESKTYNLVITNDNFELVDVNGNPLTSFTINGNSEEQNTVYIKIKPGARFASSAQNINIFLSHDGSNSNMGLVRLTVPRDENLVDVTPPSISNVVGTFQSAKGNVLVTYNASDNIGINKFTLEVYKNNSLVSTRELGPDITNYTVTNLDDGNYYFKVIAEDTSGLTNEASSTPKNYIWIMNVNINITQGGPNGNYTVDYGNTYQTTITANGNRNLPNTLTITMGGVTLNNDSYTYNNRNGNLRIPNVTGDLSITGATTGNLCLIKGTKVLMADYTYKNIEDVKYDDLLMVWNYETGKLTKEYPIWMENEKVSNSYTKIDFSDGSSIGVVGAHAFFNSDYKEFVSALDKEKFHVGSNILKVDGDKLKKVKVTKIKEIKKKVEYYFVASTRYWNIITNDFVTTDGYTDITNLYKFDDNITWDKNREVIKVDYKEIENVLPYYLFKGFRAEEVGVLIAKNQGNIQSFKDYVNELIVNSRMIKNPIMNNNERYWMVTTSEDIVINKKDYLVKEGDYYKLPKGSWYSTSENKIYKGVSKVQVWTGMHFEKIK